MYFPESHSTESTLTTQTNSTECSLIQEEMKVHGVFNFWSLTALCPHSPENLKGLSPYINTECTLTIV